MASVSRFIVFFFRCSVSFSCWCSRCMVSFSRCTLAKSALNAATSSPDRGLIPSLAVPAPRRCLSYILLHYAVPDGHRKLLYVAALARLNTYLTRSFRPPRLRVSINFFCTPPSRLTNVYVAPLARLNTALTPILRCLHQADISIYRVRMRQLRQRPKEKRRLTQDPCYIIEEIT